MTKKLTLLDCQQIAEERQGKCLSLTYGNVSSLMNWECAEGHIFQQRFNDIRHRGTWCPKCSHRAVPTLQEVQDFVAERNGKCLSTTYVNAHTYMEWECHEGHTFKSKYGEVHQGKWCPHCSTKNNNSLEVCQEIAISRGGLCLSTEYHRPKEKLSWICSQGHKWEARFSDIKYKNSWCPKCGRESAKQSYLSNYGVDSPLKDSKIALKVASKYKYSTKKLHWKTNEVLICAGSYEARVVDYLNNNSTEFAWQSKTFNLSHNRTYRPDAYLTREDVWLEIKGWKRPDAMERWNEFHTLIHPNSELWDEPKLKQLGII